MISTSKAYRARTIKKKTRNRLILLQNLKKGKARKEDRCAFQLIPYPLKFAFTTQIHCLYADVILMERNDTLVSEASLFNHFKMFKSLQVVQYPGQKVMKVKAESKVSQPTDWKPLVDRLRGSELTKTREWGELVKDFCLKYENVIKELNNELEGMSPEKHEQLVEMNARSEKIRQNLIKTYPCIEFRCELRDGQIQFTEMSPSEKYLAEIGYTFDTFAATLLEGGIPEVTPLNSEGAMAIAKVRLQRCVTLNQDEYMTREFESHLLMKNGYTKKVKCRNHYLTFYEKGTFGFVFMGTILAKQKPGISDIVNPTGQNKLSTDFVEFMADREEQMNNFASNFYNQTVEKVYTNLSRTCKIKEIKNAEETD